MVDYFSIKPLPSGLYVAVRFKNLHHLTCLPTYLYLPRHIHLSPSRHPTYLSLPPSALRPPPQMYLAFETGNITFSLPHQDTGKNPNIYNYIGHDSVLAIRKRNKVEMKPNSTIPSGNKYYCGIMFKSP